jgi:tRNA (guanine-N7-)-methyltransferase
MAVFPGKGLISSTNCSARSESSAAGALPYPLRVYGRKRGRRLRPGQQTLTHELLPRIAIDLPRTGEIDPAALFARPPPSVWLEVGFGGGEHLADQAQAHPDIGLIGCEVFETGVAKLLGEIERRQLTNIRLFTGDARHLIGALTAATIGCVFILFPDPWPKARHHKRRIVSGETLDQLARIMTDEGELRLATDDPAYFASMLAQVTSHPAFEWLARRPADWRHRPPGWPPTRYEEKARAAGRPPLFLHARRCKRRAPQA